KIASQKPGKETSSEGRLRKKVPIKPSPGTVARYATISARIMARHTEVVARAQVEGRCSATIVDTAAPDGTEVPKLPVTNPPRVVKHCTKMGLSLPISSRMPSISAWESPSAGAP